MKTDINWLDFDTRAEAQALADYIVAKWDGITKEESDVLALHAFHRGWDAVGDYFSGQTFQGKTVYPTELYLNRMRTMKNLGYSGDKIVDDSVLDILRGYESLSWKLKKPQYFEEGVDPLIKEALTKLGKHLESARPKGWKSGRTYVYTHPESDKELFQGVKTVNPGGPGFIEWISLPYVKTGVYHHDDAAFTMLVGAMYSHGYKTREMHNNELMGMVISSIDTTCAYFSRKQKIDVLDVPYVTALMQKHEAARYKRVNLVPLPTTSPALIV